MGNHNSIIHTEYTNRKIRNTFLPNDLKNRLTHCMVHDLFKDCFEIVRDLIQHNHNAGKDHKDLFCKCFKKYIVENDVQVNLVVIGKKSKRIAHTILYNYWLTKLGVVRGNTYVKILRRVSKNRTKEGLFDILKYLKEQSFSNDGVYIGIPAFYNLFNIEHFDAIFNNRDFMRKLYKFQLIFDTADGRLYMRDKEETHNFYLSAGFIIIEKYKKHIRGTNDDDVAVILGSAFLAIGQAYYYDDQSSGDSIGSYNVRSIKKS